MTARPHPAVRPAVFVNMTAARIKLLDQHMNFAAIIKNVE